MKRIDNLTRGESVQLRLATRGGGYDVEQAIFVGVEGEGEDRKAMFVQADRNLGVFSWEAYRYNGRWCYGSSADRLSLDD